MSRGTFVGRDELRLELARALHRARTGHGQLLLLSGEAGVGKTRLVTEALAEANDLRVLAAPSGPQDAYAPLVAVLRHYRRSSTDTAPFESAAIWSAGLRRRPGADRRAGGRSRAAVRTRTLVASSRHGASGRRSARPGPRVDCRRRSGWPSPLERCR